CNICGERLSGRNDMRRQLSPVKCYRAPTLPLDLRVPATFYVVRRIPHLFFSHSSLACQAVASRHAVALREGWLAKAGHSSPSPPRAQFTRSLVTSVKLRPAKFGNTFCDRNAPAIAPQTKKFAAFFGSVFRIPGFQINCKGFRG